MNGCLRFESGWIYRHRWWLISNIKINKEINGHKYNWKDNGNIAYANEFFVSTIFSKEK